MKDQTALLNEMRAMINFVHEFRPIYEVEDLENISYWRLIELVKEIAKEM